MPVRAAPSPCLSASRIEEFDLGRWQAIKLIEVIHMIDGTPRKVGETVIDRHEISIDDAIAELTRRGEMTGHEAIAARRRAWARRC